MLTFSDLCCEGIRVVDGRLSFNDIGDDTQSVSFGKHKFIPYTSKAVKYNGVTIHSAYKLTPKIGNNILKTLKRKTDVVFDESDYDSFIQRTAVYLASSKFGLLNNTDVIVTPQTSSFIIKDVLEAVSNIRPSIKIIYETFKKVDVNSIRVDYDDMPVSMAKRMNAILANARKVGFLEIKKVPKQFLSFVHNFLQLDDMNIRAKDIDGSRVVVFDDLLGSGFTMKEMVNIINQLSPSLVSGMTIFKV